MEKDEMEKTKGNREEGKGEVEEKAEEKAEEECETKADIFMSPVSHHKQVRA